MGAVEEEWWDTVTHNRQQLHMYMHVDISINTREADRV